MYDMKYNFRPVHITPDRIIGESFYDSDENSPSYVNWYLMAQGSHEEMEMSDTIYHKDEIIPYHNHISGMGAEVFLIDGGSVEVWLNGKKAVCHKGDIIYVPKNTLHGFKYLSNPVIWREYFEGMNMNEGLLIEQRIREFHPEDYYQKGALNKIYFREGTYFYDYEPVLEEVDAEEIYEVRQYNKPLHRRVFEGIEMQLRISRPELTGNTEIWQYNVEKGYEFSFDHWNPHVIIFDVYKGSIKVDIEGMEPFVAKERDIVRIPSHVAGTITVLENSELIDYHCKGFLLAATEEIKAVAQSDPALLKDEEKVKELLARYDIFTLGKLK